MRGDPRSNTGVAERESVQPHVEVEVRGRWNALAVSALVHARAPGCHGESPDDRLRTIEACERT